MYMDWTYTNDSVLDNTALGVQGDYIVQLHLLGDVLDDVKLRSKTLLSLTEELKRSRIFLIPEQCYLVWQYTSTTARSKKSGSLIISFHCWLPEYSRNTPQSTLQILYYKLQAYSWIGTSKNQLVDWEVLEERVETYIEGAGDA